MKATVGAALLPILTKLAVFVNNQLLPGITNFASGVRSAGDFVRSNSTTFKILAAVLAAAVLPTVVAVTFAFIAQLASTVALTAAWLAYALVVNAMSIATKVAAATQWLLNVAMSANPIALIVIAIIGLIAIIVLVATKTKFFQTIWKAAMGFITNAAQAVFGWLKRNWPLLLAIITGPIGLAVLFIVRHWSQIKSATSSLVSAVIGFFSRLGSGVRDKIGDAVAFAKAMPVTVLFIVAYIPEHPHRHWFGTSLLLLAFAVLSVIIAAGLVRIIGPLFWGKDWLVTVWVGLTWSSMLMRTWVLLAAQIRDHEGVGWWFYRQYRRATGLLGR